MINSLTGFAAEYFEKQENGQRKKDDEASLKAYRTVLTSKNNEETMASTDYIHYHGEKRN